MTRHSSHAASQPLCEKQHCCTEYMIVLLIPGATRSNENDRDGRTGSSAIKSTANHQTISSSSTEGNDQLRRWRNERGSTRPISRISGELPQSDTLTSGDTLESAILKSTSSSSSSFSRIGKDGRMGLHGTQLSTYARAADMVHPRQGSTRGPDSTGRCVRSVNWS